MFYGGIPAFSDKPLWILAVTSQAARGRGARYDFARFSGIRKPQVGVW